MSLTPEPIERQFLTNIKSILDDYIAEQILLNSSVGFNVYVERTYPPQQTDLPAVFVYFDQADSDRYAIGKSVTYDGTIRFDLLASEPAGSNDSDSASAYRVLYLYQQIRTALYRSENYDLGMAPGVVGKRSPLSFARLETKDEHRERRVSAATCEMQIQYRIEYKQPDYHDLEVLSIDEDKIKLTINY